MPFASFQHKSKFKQHQTLSSYDWKMHNPIPVFHIPFPHNMWHVNVLIKTWRQVKHLKNSFHIFPRVKCVKPPRATYSPSDWQMDETDARNTQKLVMQLTHNTVRLRLQRRRLIIKLVPRIFASQTHF